MILQPLLPIAALIVVGAALLTLCVWQLVAARRAKDNTVTWAWVRRGFAVVVLISLGLGPSLSRDHVETVVSDVEVYFVVDRTGSMAAEDYDGKKPRLDGVKTDLRELADALPGARYSIIGFDSTATRQLPLTTDVRAVRTWADTLKQEFTGSSSGSLIDRPLDALKAALVASYERSPDSVRVVFFLSDGENTELGTPRSYAELAPLVSKGAVLGYGTEVGGRMKINDPSSKAGKDYILDYTKDGAPEAISKIDETQLKAVASDLGIPYLHRSAPGELDQATADIDLSKMTTVGQRTITTYEYLTWPFAGVLVLLLVWELAMAAGRVTKPVGVIERGEEEN